MALARVSLLLWVLAASAMCLPVHTEQYEGADSTLQLGSLEPAPVRLWKRFVHRAGDDFAGLGLGHKIRTKRSSHAEECERLELCKLHARAQHNFLSSFQLYFVNKENAHLWDHRQHTAADCELRYAAACHTHTHPNTHQYDNYSVE